MSIYNRHRFRPNIIGYAVWLNHRFSLSHRDVEDLLAKRCISVSYEIIRLGVLSLVLYTLAVLNGDTVGMAIRSTSMNSLSI